MEWKSINNQRIHRAYQDNRNELSSQGSSSPYNSLSSYLLPILTSNSYWKISYSSNIRFWQAFSTHDFAKCAKKSSWQGRLLTMWLGAYKNLTIKGQSFCRSTWVKSVHNSAKNLIEFHDDCQWANRHDNFRIYIADKNTDKIDFLMN